MKELAARSMEEGAWGLVTRFGSGGPSHPDEVLELARIVAAYGGNYTSHHGSEGYEQEREIDFAIRVAEEIGLPVHLFHFKIRARNNWGTIDRSIDQIARARARGLDITANQYPYTAMFHGWSSFFPLWMREGGPDAFARRLRDESLRERIKSDPDFIAWAEEHGWWEGIVLARASLPEVRRYEGMRVAEIAESLGVDDPADVVIDLMAAEGGSISGVFHTMSEEDVRLIMRQPWVAHASDGSAINLDAPGVPHPRNYGMVPRVLGHYVRDEGVLNLEDAVRKMTSLPAQILGLADRGQLRAGFVADVALFDPDGIAETNSFENPKSYPGGDSLRDRQRDPRDRRGRAHRRPAGKGSPGEGLPAGAARERRDRGGLRGGASVRLWMTPNSSSKARSRVPRLRSMKCTALPIPAFCSRSRPTSTRGFECWQQARPRLPLRESQVPHRGSGDRPRHPSSAGGTRRDERLTSWFAGRRGGWIRSSARSILTRLSRARSLPFGGDIRSGGTTSWFRS